MKKIFFLFIVPCVLFSVISCNKQAENFNVKAGSIETLLTKYLNVRDAKGGSVVVSSTNRNFKNDPVFDIKASLAEPVYDEISLNNEVKLIPYLSNGEATNYYSLPKTIKNKDLIGLFGKELNISFSSNSLSLRNGSSVYSPTTFVMSGGSRNTSLSWNAGNGGNVYILISFEPGRAINEAYSGYSGVTRYIETSDDGFHQLTESDFAGIPLGGNIDVIVVRGNVAIIGGQTNGGGAVSVQAYSTSIISGSYGGGGGSGDGSGGIPTINMQ